MKTVRIITVLLLAATLLLATACAESESNTESEQSQEHSEVNTDSIESAESSESAIVAHDVNFEVQYIRNLNKNKTEYPDIRIIRSVAEMEAYFDEFKCDSSIVYYEPFQNACAKYTEAYFENRIVVMVLLEESSGSVSHEVNGVRVNEEGKTEISITGSSPMFQTADMAYWHIFIEPEAGTEIADKDDILLSINYVTTD